MGWLNLLRSCIQNLKGEGADVSLRLIFLLLELQLLAHLECGYRFFGNSHRLRLEGVFVVRKRTRNLIYYVSGL